MITSDSESEGESVEQQRLPSTHLPDTDEEIMKALSTAPSSVFRLLKWKKPESMLPDVTHVPIWMTAERRNHLLEHGTIFYSFLYACQ